MVLHPKPVYSDLQMRSVLINIHFHIHNIKKTFSFWLTFIQYLETNIWSAVIGDKQQIQKVAAAKQELGNLGAIKGANQRRQEVWSIMDLQDVITQLCLESVRQEMYYQCCCYTRDSSRILFWKALLKLLSWNCYIHTPKMTPPQPPHQCFTAEYYTA